MKHWLAAIALLFASTPALANWQDTLAQAKGQTVYWNAWGGDTRTNDFISWVSEQTEAQFGVSIEQVPLSDTAEAVNRVLSEKAAGQDEGGSVDLIWINGPNFFAMKSQNLLHGPFAKNLPNARFVDYSEQSPASLDFTVPTEGFESPWRLAKFVYIYDEARLQNPPETMGEWLAWISENPGRFTHPIPTDFMGATFLKQALIELASEPEKLYQTPNSRDFQEVTAPFWEWYEAVHVNFWQKGKNFPRNQFDLQNLFNDREVDFAMSFDPASTAASIKKGELPETARVFVPQSGTIGNLSFVAIPYNASNKAGAEVVANFLLSPEAQAQMQNIDILGSFSVLDPAKLPAEAQNLFAELPKAPALPNLEDLGKTLSEPHPDWMNMLVEEWQKRYAN